MLRINNIVRNIFVISPYYIIVNPILIQNYYRIIGYFYLARVCFYEIAVPLTAHLYRRSIV